MATIGGSNIATNGLVLALDAANPKSYVSGSTTWNDLSGNDNHVAMQNSGSITWNSNGYFSTGATGWFSKTSGVNMPTGSSLYAFSAWIQLGLTWGNNTGIMSVGPFGTTNQSNALRTIGTNALHNYWWSNDLTVTTSLSPANQWFNVVAMDDGTNRSIWVNGVSMGTGTRNNHNVTNSDIQIAKTYSTEYLNGNIAYASIYNRALTPVEIIQNYNAQKSRYNL
jgi:hypothetical protein